MVLELSGQCQYAPPEGSRNIDLKWNSCVLTRIQATTRSTLSPTQRRTDGEMQQALFSSIRGN
jgi:hypothetical protein